MPISTYNAEYNHFYTAPYIRSQNQPYIVRNVFIWLSWEQKFPDIKLLLKMGCTCELVLLM